jgi:peptidoglycan-associated lipoprotein
MKPFLTHYVPVLLVQCPILLQTSICALFVSLFVSFFVSFFAPTLLISQTATMPCETSIKQLLVVVDVSGSMGTNERLSEVKQFVLRTLKEREKENLLYKLVSYGGSCNDVLTDVEWTRDVAVIGAGIKGLYLRGGTPLGSALEYSMDAIKKSAYPDQTQILVLNDGANGCGEVREILARRLREIPCVKINVVGIELEDDENNLADRAKSDAEAIATQTGGRNIALKDVRELRGLSTSDTGVTVRTVAFEPRKKPVKPTPMASNTTASNTTTNNSTTNNSTANSTTTSSVATSSATLAAASRSESPRSESLRSESEVQAKPAETAPKEASSTKTPSRSPSSEEQSVRSEPVVSQKEEKPQETKPQEQKPTENTSPQIASNQVLQEQPTQEQPTQEQPTKAKFSEEPAQAQTPKEPRNNSVLKADSRSKRATAMPREKEELQQESEAVSQKAPEAETTNAQEKSNEAASDQSQDEGIMIFFTPNSSALLPSMRKGLERLVEELRRFPARKITVDGHTSLEGSAEANLRLSVLRASSVAAFLRSQLAMPAQNVVWNAFGELHPIAANSDAAGQQENRRVEVRVVR